MKSLLSILALFSIIPLPSSAEVRRPAAVSTMLTSELADFDKQPVEVQTLIRSALGLTEQKLTYVFGSHDPKRGGMDCSGAIYYLLTQAGLSETPRQSDQICEWLMKKGLFRRTAQADTLDHPELATLRPGDLLFWSGTYNTTRRKTPVTHVMLYLGKTRPPVSPSSLEPAMAAATKGKSAPGSASSTSSYPKKAPRPTSMVLALCPAS